MVPATPSSGHTGYTNSNIEVTQCILKLTRYENATFVMNIVTNIT